MTDIRSGRAGSAAGASTAERAGGGLVRATDSGPVIDLRRTRLERALPTFPDMANLAAEHLPAIREATDSFDSYSDFDPVSLWSWSGSVPEGYRVASCNGNVVVEFADYLSGERFLSFIGDRAVNDTAATLLAHAAEDPRLAEELRLVPEVGVAALDPSHFDVAEDVDSADYVYLAADGARMAGQRYKSLRWTHNSWSKRWAARSRLVWLDRAELSAHSDLILRSLRARRSANAAVRTDLDMEIEAITRLLDTPATWGAGFDGWSGLCMTDDEMCAVFINERLGDRISGHFLKVTDHDCGRGFMAWYFVELCRRADAEGVAELNLQQDLGIVGIRAAKQQLRPSRMLHKYVVRSRAG